MGESQIKGREFEKNIKKIFKMIAKNERINASVTRDVKLKGRNGLEEQFDVVYEYEYFGYRYRVAIECKNYASKAIEKAEIYVFEKKIKNVGNLNGIFISKSAKFQSGAQTAANDIGIKILCLDDLDGYISGVNEEFLIPNSKTIGEPFWSIATNKRQINSVENLFGKRLYLFESKYFVEKYLETIFSYDDGNLKIIGISQGLLKLLGADNKMEIKMFSLIDSNLDKLEFNFKDLKGENINIYIWE